MLRNSFVFLLSRTIRHDAGAFMITPLRQYRYSAITNTKLRDNYNLLQKQSQVGFSPEKFALGFLGGAGGSVAVGKARKYAIMRRMSAKKNDKKLYETFKKIDSSPKFGAKMKLIGKENLNADVLAYALANNKRVAINKLKYKRLSKIIKRAIQY